MVYKWYILPIGGLYTTYHPLQEPEKSIDFLGFHVNVFGGVTVVKNSLSCKVFFWEKPWENFEKKLTK